MIVIRLGLWLVLLILLTAPCAFGQLNENCVVSVLNRNVQVNHDGTWVLPNIPANFGRVRARATCVQNGVTTSGESDYFTIPTNGSVDVPQITLGSMTAIPTSLTITALTNTLTTPGATTQLRAVGTYVNRPATDLTAASTGTSYVSSNPAIATVSVDGLVTAVRSGTVLVQATNEGTQGILMLRIAFAGGIDTDGDGIPDDAEITLGLNPNDAADAQLDLDHDGLTNLEEYQRGTNLRNADTDSDGLTDGEEVRCTRVFCTNPLLADTDGDGINDLTEIQTGSDPTNPSSFNLNRALSSIEVNPASFTLIVNSLSGIASVQLAVTGHLIDNRTINLTSTSRGTNYASSNLNVCNFGAPDGRVFASAPGQCTITVTNNGFTAAAQGVVNNFSPSALSFVTIPGFANGVAVNGDYAYIAAGASGLQVVGLDADRTNPQVVASLSLPGNANAVTLAGNLAYIAAGNAGLHVVDIANPLTPHLLGSFSTGGNARGVKVRGTTAFVANSSNLQIVNAANPGAMIQISTLSLNGTVWNLEIDNGRNLAAVAAGSGGVYLVDISNLAAPVVRGSVATGDARSVAMNGNFAFVADHTNSMRALNTMNPAAPTILSTTPQNLGGLLNDIVLSGDFALGADVFFVNGIPIVDITTPASLQPRAILNFPARDDNGMGIAVDSSFVYLVAEHSSLDRGGSTGNSRLYIGQFRPRADLAGIPPTVTITSPTNGATQYEGASLTVSVDAADDVAVASVQFLVNGQVAFTTTSAPYQYTFTVPNGSNALTLGAKAVDLAGNIGNAADVTVPVIPDPLTLVTGQIVDTDNNPLPNATVTAPGGRTGVTGTDGRFAISGVPTVVGNIFITGSFTAPDGNTLTGTSASFPPVRGGVTDVGTTTLIAAKFETNFGTRLTNCDDCNFLRTLPFTFRFFGVNYTNTYVGTNGYFTFNQGDSTYVESLPAFTSLPRISAFFDDLYGGRSSVGAVYVNDQIPGRFIVTHDRVPHFSAGGSNTLQIQIYQDGRIVFAFNGITSVNTGSITGITPGPNTPFQQVDYSTNRNFDTPAGTTVYEYFTAASTFDLDHGFVIFTPKANGGYNVRTILSTEPALSSLVTGGPVASRKSVVIKGAGPTTGATPSGPKSLPVNLANAEVIVTSSSDINYIGMANTDPQGQFTLNGVPAGGINVVIRRYGQIIAQGAGVFAGGDLSEAQVLNIVVAPMPKLKKQLPNQ
ncbi:MAG: Ig-like domain-containing protein [Pyrinomonadaceae bacterium]